MCHRVPIEDVQSAAIGATDRLIVRQLLQIGLIQHRWHLPTATAISLYSRPSGFKRDSAGPEKCSYKLDSAFSLPRIGGSVIAGWLLQGLQQDM